MLNLISFCFNDFNGSNNPTYNIERIDLVVVNLYPFDKQNSIENIDIGCMQINKYWHQNNFVSSKEMMDPFHNIMYAAYFLNSQYKKTKSWKQSIKNYHSKNPKYNNNYFKNQ